MRTHAQIIKGIGAPRLAELLQVSLHTVRSWAQRQSIPAEHWKAISELEGATLNELADAAARRFEGKAA